MKTVLAIKWRNLGDTVLWTSSLQALVDLGYAVEIAYPEKYKDLFLDDPRFPFQHWVSKDLNLEKSFDAVLNFHASPSSAALTKRVKSHQRVIHFHSRIPKTDPSSSPIPQLGVPLKATERDLNVVRALADVALPPPTRIYLKAETSSPFQPYFQKNEKPWLLLGPEASRPSKEWPLEYYVEVAKKLSSKYSIGFVAENSLKVKTDPRYQELSKIATYFSTPRLRDLMSVLSLAKFYLGSDSGIKHLAVALGLKTVTLFGPESIGEWHCYEDHTALQVEVACRDQDPSPKEFAWCNAQYCPLASHACLRLIRPEDVVKVL